MADHQVIIVTLAYKEVGEVYKNKSSCSVSACVCVFLTVSGGNKRKLSTAVALVGDPPIVFLVSNVGCPQNWIR